MLTIEFESALKNEPYWLLKIVSKLQFSIFIEEPSSRKMLDCSLLIILIILKLNKVNDAY